MRDPLIWERGKLWLNKGITWFGTPNFCLLITALFRLLLRFCCVFDFMTIHNLLINR